MLSKSKLQLLRIGMLAKGRSVLVLTNAAGTVGLGVDCGLWLMVPEAMLVMGAAATLPKTGASAGVDAFGASAIVAASMVVSTGVRSWKPVRYLRRAI